MTTVTNKARSCLFLRGGAIGDMVLTIPTIAAFRHQQPEMRLCLAGYPHIGPILMETGLVDEFVSLDLPRFARLFSQVPFWNKEDLAFFVSFDIAVSWLLDDVGQVLSNLKTLPISRVVTGSPLPLECHAAEHLFKPVISIGITTPGTFEPRINPTKRMIQRGISLAAPFGAKIAIIQPGSGSLRKNWPFARFLAIARQIRMLHLTPLILTGPAEDSLTGMSASDEIAFVSNLPLRDVVALLSVSTLYIGNDSGITHLAAAVGTPTIAIFGPTDPFMWAPLGKHVRVVRDPSGSLENIGETDVMKAVWEVLHQR